jgi:hypothetical protein
MVCRTLAGCATHGCRGYASVLCRFPVRRGGRDCPCGRFVCTKCASAARYCPPHARAADAGKVATVTICSRCFSASCAAADDDWQCNDPGPARVVTVPEWKKLISFGVL